MSTNKPAEPDEPARDEQREWQDAAPLSKAGEKVHPHHRHAPRGYQLGEHTLQSYSDPPRYLEDDFSEMRDHFGIPPFDVEAFTETNDGCIVYPDLVIHRRNPTVVPSDKGMDALIRGKKGSGKTTFLKVLAIRLGENNQERVIHRGRTDDSGWLELRWWTTLWLPANASVTATWVYEEDEEKTREPAGDLSDIVRSVRYYDDLYDLIDQLAETPVPSYHVVYPDPSFSGCEDVMRESNKTGQVLPYTPAWDATGGGSPTPLPQWWIAFMLCQLEHGHYDAFMSWICDEAHQVFGPPNPPEDDHRTDKKFKLANQLLNEARKRMFSWYLATQSEGKLDYRILDEVRTRVYLADGRKNPVKTVGKSIPYGWTNVPMDADWMSGKNQGHGLCFVEAETEGYAEFQWDALTPHPDDENRWLEIRLNQPEEQVRGRGQGQRTESDAAFEYDEQFFEQHEQTNQLYVKQPGRGRVSLSEPAIVEDLVAPSAEHYDSISEVTIRNELRRSEDDTHWLITGTIGVPNETGGVQPVETTFVRIPIGGYRLGGEA